MTGTGTQTDPYVVMNVGEFIEATSDSSEFPYIKLGADINMDGIHNQYAYFTEIDGDNHTIMNMVCFGDDSNERCVLYIPLGSLGATIKNVNFRACMVCLNTVLLSAYRMNSSSKTALFLENCNFSICIKTNSGNTLIIGGSSTNYPVSTTISKCVFDIIYESTSTFNACIVARWDTLIIVDSHLRTNIFIDAPNSSRNAWLFGTIRNSYITGRFECVSSLGTGQALFGGTYYHTYIAIKSKHHGKTVLISGSCPDTCFYDAQAWNNNDSSISISNSGKLYALPTEKCKDAEYLNSIGFYVVPEE